MTCTYCAFVCSQAVESRLLKIEERLDYVEAVVSGISHAEGRAVYNDLKRDVELLQARITLLENRVTLAESKVRARACATTVREALYLPVLSLPNQTFLGLS
jgi:intracellular sulfur oxidation DsrE/DsrF family protein